MAASGVSFTMAVPQRAPEHQGGEENKITLFNLNYPPVDLVDIFHMFCFNCARKKRYLRSWSVHDFRNGVTMRRSPLTILKVFLLEIILI